MPESEVKREEEMMLLFGATLAGIIIGFVFEIFLVETYGAKKKKQLKSWATPNQPPVVYDVDESYLVSSYSEMLFRDIKHG